VCLGAPQPVAKWSKNGSPVSKAELVTKPDVCKVKMKNMQRGDGGEYLMDVENKSGVDKVPITITVIGKLSLPFRTSVIVIMMIII
jgi:hypothetical protein